VTRFQFHAPQDMEKAEKHFSRKKTRARKSTHAAQDRKVKVLLTFFIAKPQI
jgi:hypothetical protein